MWQTSGDHLQSFIPAKKYLYLSQTGILCTSAELKNEFITQLKTKHILQDWPCSRKVAFNRCSLQDPDTPYWDIEPHTHKILSYQAECLYTSFVIITQHWLVHNTVYSMIMRKLCIARQCYKWTGTFLIHQAVVFYVISLVSFSNDTATLLI